MKTINAIHITTQTLIGSFGDFPRKSGNCFSVETEDGGQYRIVNFIVENLEEAVRLGVEWPIKISPIGKKVAVIHDERIPHDWYSNRWCSTCCPVDLLPINQKMERDREIMCGALVEHDITEGILKGGKTQVINWKKLPKLGKQKELPKTLKGNWKFEFKEPVVQVGEGVDPEIEFDIQSEIEKEIAFDKGLIYTPYIPKNVKGLDKEELE